MNNFELNLALDTLITMRPKRYEEEIAFEVAKELIRRELENTGDERR